MKVMKSQLQQKVVIQITIKYIGDISQCFCENANLLFPHRWMRVDLMVCVLVFSDRAVRVRTVMTAEKIYIFMYEALEKR